MPRSSRAPPAAHSKIRVETITGDYISLLSVENKIDLEPKMEESKTEEVIGSQENGRESGIELSAEKKAGPLSEATVQKLINAALVQQKRAAKTDER
jgi:hypothetical protein